MGLGGDKKIQAKLELQNTPNSNKENQECFTMVKKLNYEIQI